VILCRFASSSGRFERSCCFSALPYAFTLLAVPLVRNFERGLSTRSNSQIKPNSLTAILRNIANCSPYNTLSSPRTLKSSATPMSESPVSLVGVFVEGYIVLRCDAVLIGNLLHFGGTGLYQFHGSATPSFVLVLYDYRLTQCFPNFFARGPPLSSKNNHGSSHTC